MAALKIALLILVSCVALNQSAPRGTRGRLEKLEKVVQKLAKESSDFKKLREHLRPKFATKFAMLIKDVQTLMARKWSLRRTYYDLPGYQKTVLKADKTEMTTIPTGMLPSNTRAIVVGIKCDEWKETFKAQMTLKMKQTGNVAGGETVLTAPMNDFYYEIMVPWDTKYANQMSFTTQGTSKNTYSITLTGYITG